MYTNGKAWSPCTSTRINACLIPHPQHASYSPTGTVTRMQRDGSVFQDVMSGKEIKKMLLRNPFSLAIMIMNLMIGGRVATERGSAIDVILS